MISFTGVITIELKVLAAINRCTSMLGVITIELKAILFRHGAYRVYDFCVITIELKE